MLRWYHLSQTLPCICCHSPALLRAHCKEATACRPMLLMIQELFSRKRLCCMFIFPGEPGFLLPRFWLVWTSPYHSRQLPLLSAQNLPKTQAAKVQRRNSFLPAWHGTATDTFTLAKKQYRVMSCRAVLCRVNTLSQSVSANTARHNMAQHENVP